VTSWPGSTSQKSREIFTEHVIAPEVGRGVGEVKLNVTVIGRPADTSVPPSNLRRHRLDEGRTIT
jgi:hypothetical protein